MSHITTDILIVTDKISPNAIVNSIDTILKKNKFNIETGSGSTFFLDELEEDEHLEKGYDTARYVENPRNDLELLKSHPGGAISYQNDNEDQLLVGFSSIDDMTINGILFYTRTYFAEKDKELFDTIIKIIVQEMNVIGIIKGDNLFDKLDEETEIKNTIKGNINKEYEYIVL